MNPYEPMVLPLEGIDWAAHVRLIGQANAALARYDGMLQGIVNPVVFLSPLTTQEAVLSSRIEGTQASMEEVLEFEAEDAEPENTSRHADIQEIINYRAGIAQAMDGLDKRPLCLNMLRELHATLLDSVRGRNKAPGEFRRVQNYIGPPGCTMNDASFVPPATDRMMSALDNWEKYLHQEEKDRLVQLAVIKAQFELIHPFLDGNGRIGRMLVPLFLYEKSLLSSPMFYLSAYFDLHRDVYYARLQAISKEDAWNSWIDFFLRAVYEQANNNAEKVRGVLALYEEMKIRIARATRSEYSIQALDALFSRPVFRASDFATRSAIPTRQTAASILRRLQQEEIITTLKPASGRRPAMLAFPSLINLVEERKVV